LHQSLFSVEDELNNISLQWDSKWQGISEDISNWQEATLEDIEAKIVSIKQELPDRSELEEWEKKINILQEEGERLKRELVRLEGEKDRALQEGEERLSKLEEEILLWEKELADYQKLMEQSISEINKQVSELTTFLNSAEERLREIETYSVNWSKESQDAWESLKISLSQLSERLEEVSNFSQNVLKKELEAKIDSIEEKIEEMRKELNKEKQTLEISHSVTSTTEEDGETSEESVVFSSGMGGEEVLLVEEPLESKEKLSAEIKTLAEEKMELEEELSKKQEEMLKIDQELEELREEKGSWEKIEELEGEKVEKEKAIADLNQKLEEKNAQIEALQREITELTAQLEEAEKYTSYVILPWDNLWDIARRYYRDGRKWPLIMEANKDVIEDPLKLRPYTEIRIPRCSNDEDC